MFDRIWIKLFVILTIFVSLLLACGQNQNTEQSSDFTDFENNLEKSRLLLNIPAFSAAVVEGENIIWAKGFGFADIKNQKLAEKNTIYHLASLTKTFASTIIMQLIEEGKVALDDPISKYGISLDQAREFNMNVSSEEKIKVRHLLTHTAEGNPGERYNYNGYLFGLLDAVIEKSSGKTFGELVTEKIIIPLQLKNTAPNFKDTVNFDLTGYEREQFFSKMAKPYILDSLNQLQESELETYFGTAAGLMSSVIDIAKYSMAIDNNNFFKPEFQENIFSPAVSTNGDTLPYAYGWFSQNFLGEKYVWHYGYWNTNSSLIVKIPEKKLTFVILANSNNLSRPFGLGAGDLFTSIFAIEFIKKFANPELNYEIDWDSSKEVLKSQLVDADSSPYRNLVKKELFSEASLQFSSGKEDLVTNLFQVYSDIYSISLPDKYLGKRIIAAIEEVINSKDLSTKFEILEEDTVHIYAIGEGEFGDMWDYGWIENSSGDLVWKMDEPETVHAGGDPKNRLSEQKIKLKPGIYKLNFKTDDSHSFGQWNSFPPEYNFYGIRIYKN